MPGRERSSSLVAVEGRVPAPTPIHRRAPVLVALAVFAGAVAWVALVVLLGGTPLMLLFAVPAPWLFLALVPSAAAMLLAFRGVVAWSLVLALLSTWLVPTGVATIVVVVVALWSVRRIRSQWAAHDLDSVIATAAANELPVLTVQHVAGGQKKRGDSQTTQIQVRDVDSGELSTARVWGRMQVGTTLVRHGMNVIVHAPPGAEDDLRRWVERENRRTRRDAARLE